MPLDATTLVLATRNHGKLAELNRLLASLPLTLLPIHALSDAPEPIEDGLTCAHNALLKARHAAALTGLPALADDCGLFVDALHGAPGVLLARYARDAGGWAHGMDRLLQQLRDADALLPHQRAATFTCALAIAWPDGRALTAQGDRPGLIADAPRGLGDGFDPLFLPRGADLTWAQLPPHLREATNHRALAFDRLLQHL
jgi:XTP/dITP diphosphohydrolase